MSIATDGFRKRDRLARLTRVATLVYQHRPRGLTADEIAQRIDVNVRTAYRDLHAVQEELGLAMWQEHGRWVCDQASFLPPLKLTLLEAVTLFLSVRLLARHADKNNPLMIAAFGKLASVLPAPVAVYVHAIGAAMTDGPPDRRYARVFEAVATAWATSHKLRISYSRMDASGNQVVSRRVVRPHYLEPNPSGHGCYLLAYDEQSGKVRTFKLERITDAQLTAEPFEYESNPNAPGDRLAKAWIVSDEATVGVRIRFHDRGAARRALENRWHPSQCQETMPDGTLELSFEVAGLVEITPAGRRTSCCW